MPLPSAKAIWNRSGVWIVEIVGEALLVFGWIILLAFVSRDKDLPNSHDPPGFYFFVLFAILSAYGMSGYILTRALTGIVWRSAVWWIYPTIAAALFLVHSDIFFRSFGGPNWRMVRQIQAGRICIAFICTSVGNRLLRRWLAAGPQQKLSC